MKNKEVAHILYEIADLLEMQDVEWKPRAYRRAARNIETLSTPIEDIYEDERLEEIDGVGDAIAGKIAEYMETGHLEYYEELKEELPIDIEALTAVEGVGPKTVKKLYKELGITNLDELETAAENGDIADLEGFGEKTQQNILDHIALARKGQARTLLGEAVPLAADIIEHLEATDIFDNLEVAGSFRRKKPTVGDLDILATSTSPGKAMDAFTNLDDVTEVLSQGDTKSAIVLNNTVQVDLRLVEPDQWGAALMYFTGSKDHNVALRQRALDQGYTLNEYALADKETEEVVASETEEAVFNALDLAWIPPELRENTGEIPAAENGELPDLIDVEAVKGDLQMHTTASDGSSSLRAMAETAEEKGYEYIAVTDHGPGLGVAGGLSMDEFREQRNNVEELNEELDIHIFHGVEANITDGGDLDITQEDCEEFDIVLAAYHASGKDGTDAVCTALENYPIDILAHPTNRLLLEREGLELNLDRVMETAAAENVAVEINAQPNRLDLDWSLVKQHRDDVMFVISTDAHVANGLEFMRYGVMQARKAWLEASDVINTRSLKEIRTFINR